MNIPWWVILLYFVLLAFFEELHFRLATGKDSYWWMCNQQFVRHSKVLDQFDFKKSE